MSKTELRRIDLPPASVEADVRGLIAAGGLLSSEILSHWSVGTIWTAAGPRTRVEDLINVRRGGLPEPSRFNPMVVAFIRQFLAGDLKRVAIFEDVLTRPGDAVLARAKSPYVVIDDQVFPILRGGHVDANSVMDTLTEAWSWRLVGALGTSDVPSDDLSSKAALANLVAGSRHIIVGAWDGEGILVIDRFS